MPDKTDQHRAEDEMASVDLRELLGQIDAIRKRAKDFEHEFATEIAATDPRFRDSARNLVHYAALRHADLRPLQAQLASLGLSSLGRAEQHVAASLRAVENALLALADNTRSVPPRPDPDFARIPALFDEHVVDVLGPESSGRSSRIMVTMPATVAARPDLIRTMLDSGMDIARINCAHDDAETWASMIRNIRSVCAESKSECKIMMDLAGPKLRTGRLVPGPQVLRIKPRRDTYGHIVSPKRLVIVPEASAAKPAGTSIPVTDRSVLLASPGDYFSFKDTRGRKRRLHVVDNDSGCLIVECHQRAYIESGTKLTLHRVSVKEKLVVEVGELPSLEQSILLRKDDELVLHREDAPGQPSTMDSKGRLCEPAHVSCTLPEVLEYVRVGDPVFFNDGKIEGFVESRTDSRLVVRITHAKPSGSRLRADKSINFPNTDLQISGMTEKDRRDLEFAVHNADAIGLSFIRQSSDVCELQHALANHPDSDLPGIVLKIETERGFNDLIRILLEGMRTYPLAVMIARGDLAIECGWERLAELQEEILWICEAAHVPVIWATQVLESETRKGRPSRAEITDAAMAQRADCVMLNKGPHVVEAIRTLDNILRRMQVHQSRKTAALPELSVAGVSAGS